MKLKEFVECLTKEMVENKWQNRTIEFNTIDRDRLSFLSIYESRIKGRNRICLDIGTDKDSDTHNREASAWVMKG